MKTTSVLALATLVLASCTIDCAIAAECTMDELTKASEAMMPFTNDSDCAVAATGQCPNDKCLATLKTAISKMPDCTLSGMNPKTAYDKMITACGGSKSASKPSSANSPSSATTPSPSSASSTFTLSAGVAAASAAVAVAVTFL